MSASIKRTHLAAAFLLLALGSVAFGFRTYNGVRWAGATADYRISTASFPPGSAQLREAEESFEGWNRVSGSEFLFTYQSSANSGATNHGDGVSGVAFSSQVQGSTLGVTFTSDSRGTRRAADVLFNNRSNWSFDGTPSRNEFDFGSTARHEYGHALGLQHSDRGCAALMGRGCGRNGVVRPFAADDLAGIRSLYPGTSRRGGGAPTTPTTPANPGADQDWQVSALSVGQATLAPGDSVQVGYTVAQGGPGSPASAPARAYLLSTNRTLSIQDTVLLQTGARQGPFAGGSSFQGQSTVTIPAGTAPGVYYLGVLVDPQGQVSETNEQNNGRVERIEVRVPGSTGQVDWVIRNLSVTPAQARPGDFVEVKFEVVNLGAVAAVESPIVAIYTSDNATITTRDTELQAAASTLGPFASGQGFPLRFSITIPATSQPGSVFLGVFADPNDRVAEAAEGNNTAATPLDILPPNSQGAPAPALAGAPGASTAPVGTGAQTTASGATAQAGSKSSGSSGGGCSLAASPSHGLAGWFSLLLLGGLVVLRRRV